MVNLKLNKMKEQTLIEMKNKIESLGSAVQFLMSEVSQIKQLAVGTLETIKHMDGYEGAIKDLKKTFEANKKLEI